MRILCTGGAGYVGSACLRWLLDHGHEPIAYDNLSTGNAAAVPDDRLVIGDILCKDSLANAMSEHRIDAVMHFAAVASVPDSIRDPAGYWHTNVVGTKTVLDAMLECGVKCVLFSSTAATYEFTDRMPLTEDSLQRPQVPYGTTKLACERLIADYANAYGLGFTHLRYFNASGADPNGDFGESRSSESHLIPLTLHVALGRRECLQVFGTEFPTRDGSCVRDYVHTEDLARAHQLAIEALKPGIGRAFNIGSGCGTTVLEVHKACEDVVGRPISINKADPRPGDPATLVADPSLLKATLGWNPRYPDIRSIVETAWNWHRTHPNGYNCKPAAAQTNR